jgi:hypothetical protein
LLRTAHAAWTLRGLCRCFRLRSRDLDTTRLRGFCDGQRQLEHPMLERRGDIVGRNIIWKREAALEPSVPDLRQVSVGLLILHTALARDGENLAGKLYVDVLTYVLS